MEGRTMDNGPFYSVDDIKRANRDHGHHFFDRDTLHFFRSRVHDVVYGGRYFVTSEQCPFPGDYPRLYSVRRANDDGSIDSVGEFQQYETRAQAHAAAKHAADVEVGRAVTS
jgi:hypothetical protein